MAITHANGNGSSLPQNDPNPNLNRLSEPRVRRGRRSRADEKPMISRNDLHVVGRMDELHKEVQGPLKNILRKAHIQKRTAEFRLAEGECKIWPGSYERLYRRLEAFGFVRLIAPGLIEIVVDDLLAAVLQLIEREMYPRGKANNPLRIAMTG
jgi:hypothetical protein